VDRRRVLRQVLRVVVIGSLMVLALAALWALGVSPWLRVLIVGAVGAAGGWAWELIEARMFGPRHGPAASSSDASSGPG
jgi:1,4-dihydroxy-2-naphthoate octaprenyltransferase